VGVGELATGGKKEHFEMGDKGEGFKGEGTRGRDNGSTSSRDLGKRTHSLSRTGSFL